MCKDISPSTYITNTFLISWGHFGNFLKNNLKKFTQQKKKQAKTYFYQHKKFFFILISFKRSFNINRE